MKNFADNSVICLMAPTASGKTALAYQLYETGRYELISVDSALVYREMNIGTAKPTAEELLQYPHHLVDIIDPTEGYSVASFVADVQKLVTAAHNKNKIPLLVGGTMMYYMALFDGLSHVPDSEPQVRAEVGAWQQAEGTKALHDYLNTIDPVLAARLNVSDTQRISRAIEVFKQTGRPMSDWQQQPKIALAHTPEQQWHGLAVMPDRAWLHERIAKRLDIMWQQGFVEEVIGLIDRYPLTADMPSMRCVGYRQVWDYLIQIGHPVMQKTFAEGDITEINGTFYPLKANSSDEAAACQDMQNKALYATRQLAKRQYTWLRKLINLPAAATQSVAVSQPVITAFANIQEVEEHLT